MRRLAIRAPYVLAFDGRGHRLLQDGVVVIEGDSILHVGPRFDGRVDETVDAADQVVTPGLISTHAHIAGSPLDRNATDEDVDRVYVNGRLVVDGGRVLAADEDAILRALQAGAERMWPRMSKYDWAGREVDQLSPQTYPPWDGNIR